MDCFPSALNESHREVLLCNSVRFEISIENFNIALEISSSTCLTSDDRYGFAKRTSSAALMIRYTALAGLRCCSRRLCV